MTQHPEPTY
ncbi:hypothetical protein BDFB_009053 [Asbolus verrucosus]|uniref:Uncharacterized protein n=1 Tax=Asbolus verrucosus TaxID=1661398 RepID=A0A482VZD8_ASBVE|nr:hypothetical protein BDFB_009053 [Asbolus verrucosus]